MKNILAAAVCLLAQFNVLAQTADYWQNLLHRESLCDRINTTPFHASSYAWNGSNEDYRGFVGVDTDGCKILCDFEGPGVIDHIWCTYRPITTQRLKIYVDDMLTPLIDTTIVTLFGSIEPFVPPLARKIHYSHFSDVPIPFNSRIKITTTGNYLYYEVLGQKFSPDSLIESFSLTPSATYTARLDSLKDLFNNPTVPALSDLSCTVYDGSSLVAPDQTSDVLSVNTDGVCRRLLLLLDTHDQSIQENFWISIYVDNYPLPMMSGPVSSLFGAGLGWRPYQSSLTGMSGDSLYVNLPLPFRSSLRIEARNGSSGSHSVAARVEFIEQAAADVPPLRLSASYRESLPTLVWKPHEICDESGPGNFLGMFWEMQTTTHAALEGDVRIYVDENPEPFYSGTGSEDFFNGAFFWSDSLGVFSPFQLPLHGVLRLANENASAYRWLLTNPIRFDGHLKTTMDVGGYGQYHGFYRTTAWMYKRIPRWTVVDASGDGASTSGESLRIIGYGLVPGTELTELKFDDSSLGVISGSTTVSADSLVDVTVNTPLGGNGDYHLIAVLDGVSDTIDAGWQHRSAPSLYFTAMNADADSFVFIGDTLSIALHGLPSGASASIEAASIPLYWLNEDSLADAGGAINNFVTIPSGLPDGNLELRGICAGLQDAVAEYPLRSRDFYRLEFETQPIAAWKGYRYRYQWALDHTPTWLTFPWGHNVLRYLDGTQPNDSISFLFNIRESGVYRPAYFLGLNNASAIITILIDNSLSTEVDAYTPISYGKIARSDTLYGNACYLDAGDHVATLRASSKNALSGSYDIWADQFIIKSFESYPPSFTWTSPLAADTVWTSYFLSWDAEDPDNDAVIELYAYRSGADTLHLNDLPLSEDIDYSFDWNPSVTGTGWYHLYSVIDDGYSSFTTAAPGSLYVFDSDLDPVHNLVAAVSPVNSSDLLLSWINSGALFYIVFRSPDHSMVHLSSSILDTTYETSYTIEGELISGGVINFYTVYGVSAGAPPAQKALPKEQVKAPCLKEKVPPTELETKKEVK